MENGTIKTVDDFNRFVRDVEARPGYRRPLAFGVGVAHVSSGGEVLDTFFPYPNYDENFGTAAVFADALGHMQGTHTYRISTVFAENILSYFAPFKDDGKSHKNIDVISAMLGSLKKFNSKHDGKTLVVSFIDQPPYDSGPQKVSDAYLRLHLLGTGKVVSDSIDLAQIIEVLPHIAYTSEGAIALDDLDGRRIEAMAGKHPLYVYSVGKVPHMVGFTAFDSIL